MSKVLVHHLMSSPVVTFFAEQTLSLADDVMHLRHLRHIPVVDDAQRVIGLVTHRDLLRAQWSSNRQPAPGEHLVPASVRVRDVMTEDVVTVTADQPAADAGQLMLDKHLGCLPVVDEQARLVGIVTERDLMRIAVRTLAMHA